MHIPNLRKSIAVLCAVVLVASGLAVAASTGYVSATRALAARDRAESASVPRKQEPDCALPHCQTFIAYARWYLRKLPLRRR